MQASWAKKAEGGEAGRLIVLLVEEQILCVCRALGAHRGEASKQTNMTDSGFRSPASAPARAPARLSYDDGEEFVGEGLRLEESHGFLSYGVFTTRESEICCCKALTGTFST